ncbi:MAG TPA: hypothetical protein VH374_26350 [Polyangia bacterium]|jgi:hypothetical protein|nr:hypothetical protein [Polyangia bacterium]
MHDSPPPPDPIRPKRYRLILHPSNGGETHEFPTLTECQDFMATLASAYPAKIEDRKSGRHGTLYPSGAQRWHQA